jgi:TrmH family RNA methyltransferase
MVRAAPHNTRPASPPETIRSRQNPRLQDLRRRLRRPGDFADGRIAIEGPNLLHEARRSGLRVEAVFVREDWAGEEDVAGAAIYHVAADAFDSVCTTESPQGVAALMEAPTWRLEDLLRTADAKFVVLAGLQDPGNVGAIVRAAEAFGATGLLLVPPTVHPWNPKLLRASAGSVFRLPVVSLGSVAQLDLLRRKGIPIYACDAKAEGSIQAVDFERSWAFVIGSEGAGVPDEVRRRCTGAVRIPYPGPVESLNAAVAASIALYEASRRRGFRSEPENPRSQNRDLGHPDSHPNPHSNLHPRSRSKRSQR